MTPAASTHAAHLHAADPVVLYCHGLAIDARESHLRGVLSDTLGRPGSLTRLKLGLLAGEVLGLADTTTRAFATALEYFHTASLLLDDLPCMDNARERRGRPCAHRLHGEAAAVLGALAFINRGYSLLWHAFASAPATGRDAAAAHAEHCLGVAGVLDGQSIDLHFRSSDRSPRTVTRVALGKTVSLLRLTLVTPALLVGTSPREKLLLDRLSVYWALAYQATDDCADLARGAENSSKTVGQDAILGRPNYVLAAGVDRTAVYLDRLLDRVRQTWAQLIEVRPGWHALAPIILQLNQAVIAAAACLRAEIESANRRCA